MNIVDNVENLSLDYLENEFALNFKTPLFVNLAQKYIDGRDYNRAATVCDIGLKNDPSNSLAKFILSKSYFCMGRLQQAELLLTNLLYFNPNSVGPLKVIVEVKNQLGRKKSDINKYIVKLEKLLPSNEINNNSTTNKKQAAAKPSKHKSAGLDYVKIDDNMATYAFYNIAKSQKKYNFALNILDSIEKKSGNTPKINEERRVLSNLMIS